MQDMNYIIYLETMLKKIKNINSIKNYYSEILSNRKYF